MGSQTPLGHDMDALDSRNEAQLLTPEDFGLRQRRVRLSLFWRTFFLLALLLVTTILMWLQSFRALGFEPRTIHTSQQIATIVNLTRMGLQYSDAVTRLSVRKTLAEQEGVEIRTHDSEDIYELMNDTPLGLRLTQELRQRLGVETLVASSVNGVPGLWVSFRLGDDYTWLLMDDSRLSPVEGHTVLFWMVAAIVISLAGAAIITQLLNKPIQQLSNATFRVGDGDYSNSQLDEEVATKEIRELNIGFNRMAEQLAKVEQDRAVMMAGISHDLRTPLARLRLETEMSVQDDVAREHMVADIIQLDAIIDKFLDYARPVTGERVGVSMHSVVSNCVFSIQESGEMKISAEVPTDLCVYADEVELARVVTNLLENARRYGKTPGTAISHVEIVATSYASDKYVLLKIRDHGKGASAEELSNLLKPFFRGDSARTAAAGAGLGLSIVDKTIQRMGGRFALTNASSGGLIAHIRLDRAPSDEHWQEESRLQRPQVKRNATRQAQS